MIFVGPQDKTDISGHCQAKWPAKYMSTNIQLPKVATSVSFCDSEEALLIPPNLTWGWRRRRRRHPLGCARLSQGSYQSILIPAITACHNIPGSLQPSRFETISLQSTNIISASFETPPRPELPQPSNCRRGQTVKRSNGQTVDTSKKKPENSTGISRSKHQRKKKLVEMPVPHCLKASRLWPSGYSAAPKAPTTPDQRVDLDSDLHSQSHTQKYGICTYRIYQLINMQKVSAFGCF